MYKKYLVLAPKLFLPVLLSLAVSTFGEGWEGTSATPEQDRNVSRLAQDLYVMSALFYSTREKTLRAEAQPALASMIEKLLVDVEEIQDQVTRKRMEKFLDIVLLALKDHQISDYDCEDLVTARNLALEGLSKAHALEGRCGNDDAQCLKFSRLIWSQIMATYMLKESDPSGLGGHSYFISGETDRDLARLYKKLDDLLQGVEGSSSLSANDKRAIAKIQFLRPAVISSEQGAPYLALRYLLSVYGLN